MTHDGASGATISSIDRGEFGQVVLVLQGGGALGAYQAGTYQALHEAGLEPDWVIGTSIGAINASLIAGNPPEQRLSRLTEFWTRISNQPAARFLGAMPLLGPLAANAMTIAAGVPGFFEPNPWAFLSPTQQVDYNKNGLPIRL
jgi:NTE family protein